MPSAIDIPQATLESVRLVVDACVGTERAPKALAIRSGLSARHVSYGLAAARTLGLIEPEGRAVRLTKRGRALVRTVAGSEEEREAFTEALASSDTIRQLAPDLLSDTPPSKVRLARRLQKIGSLSRNTALHRAAMILKWRTKLMSGQLRLPMSKNQAMWRRVEIRNFRSIAHATVELAPFTVVVGTNGSGKSNFADALVFARDVAFDAAAAISGRGGIVGVRRWRPSKPTDVAVDIRAARSRVSLDKSYVRHFFKIHSGRQGDWTFSHEIVEVKEAGTRKAYLERRGNAIQSEPKVPSALNKTASAMIAAKQFRQFAPTSALRNVSRYRLNPDAMRQPQLATERTRLRENGDNIATSVKSIRESARIDAIVEPMAKIVPGLQDIYVDQVGRFLALKFKQTQEEGAVADFNATEMSEGALRALGIVVATYQMEHDELLIIEEPEVSIHVGAANLLFEILKEASERGAVLLTTHSADILDAARDEEILVCDYVAGGTLIGPLADSQRQLVREGLFSVAELMRSEPLRIEGVGDRP